MKLTNSELAAARDREDWDALWSEVQTRADFSIEQVAKGATKEKERSYDGDITNTGREAAFIAMKDWEPLDNALDTHIKMRVQGAISDYRRTEQTQGIGSRRTVADGHAAEHVSMAEETGYDEEGGDMPTLLDELTYADTDNVPAGYGTPEQELARDSLDDVIAYYLHGLNPEDAHLIKNCTMGERTYREYELETGTPIVSIHRANLRIYKKMEQKAKTCFVLTKGTIDWKGLESHFPVRKRYPGFWVLPDQEAEDGAVLEFKLNQNPIWSQATGKLWNDWAYVCEDPTKLDDIETLYVVVPPRRPDQADRGAVFYEVKDVYQRTNAAGAAADQADRSASGSVSAGWPIRTACETDKQAA